MHPPTKDQADIGLDNETIDASNSDTNHDMARQEFKDEADINYMLSRFGITQPRGTPTYGEWDDAIDLQVAIMAVREANDAFRTLPKELRQKFDNMADLIRAVDNGSLVINREDPDGPKDTTEPVKPVFPTTSAKSP